MIQKSYNPDVLTCLANLSNDEVFTPPSLVNDILDLLPNDLWSNPDTKFLDPVSKSGVFLREIAKRLDKGLENKISNKQDRINHIFNNQIYGISITELTSLLARRSVYGSKIANGKYSFCDNFKDEQGNIKYERLNHTWQSGKCVYCSASQDVYDRELTLETYAYNFIHTVTPEKIFNMKFDVIVGNPPYQLSDGGAQASAKPIYQLFIQQAKKLNPRYLTMITPSRWFSGGKGLDEFRKEMLNDDRLRIIHDFIRADEIFPGVEIKGGVNYFLWDRDNKGQCKVVSHSDKSISEITRPLLEKNTDTFIRYNEAIPILRKVNKINEDSFSKIVSSRKPFGFPTNFREFKAQNFEGSIKIYANQKVGYIKRSDIIQNKDWIDKFKIYVPVAIGAGNMKTDWIKPIIGYPDTCCTETYLVLGPFQSLKETENAVSYINTRFFHLMLSLKKITQHTTNKVYSFVPIQNFDEKWTDEKLYKKYSLTDEEITFIESMIRPMDLSLNTSDDE